MRDHLEWNSLLPGLQQHPLNSPGDWRYCNAPQPCAESPYWQWRETAQRPWLYLCKTQLKPLDKPGLQLASWDVPDQHRLVLAAPYRSYPDCCKSSGLFPAPSATAAHRDFPFPKLKHGFARLVTDNQSGNHIPPLAASGPQA